MKNNLCKFLLIGGLLFLQTASALAGSKVIMSISAGGIAWNGESTASGQVYGAPVFTRRVWATTNSPACQLLYGVDYAIPGHIFYTPAQFDQSTNSYLIATGEITLLSVTMRNAVRGQFSPSGCVLYINAETNYDLPSANDDRWSNIGSSSVAWDAQGNAAIRDLAVGHALKGIQLKIANSCGDKADVSEVQLKTASGVIVVSGSKFEQNEGLADAYATAAPIEALPGNFFPVIESVTVKLKAGVATCDVQVQGLQVESAAAAQGI